METKGVKLDDNKLDWHSFPLEVLEPLIRVSQAGCIKYERFNCLKPFDNGNERFFSAAMRHLTACQLDPLAIDEETGCYHGAQAAWNLLFRVYHAIQNQHKTGGNCTDDCGAITTDTAAN